MSSPGAGGRLLRLDFLSFGVAVVLLLIERAATAMTVVLSLALIYPRLANDTGERTHDTVRATRLRKWVSMNG